MTAPGPAAHAMSSLGLTALLGCSAYLGEEERRALWEQMIKCRSVDDYEAHFSQVLQQMERFERKKAALLCKKEMARNKKERSPVRASLFWCIVVLVQFR